MQVVIFVTQAVILGVVLVHVAMNIAIARRQRALARMQHQLLTNDRKLAAQLAALRIVRGHDHLQADVSFAQPRDGEEGARLQDH
jgi:hypothetical protein